MAVDSRLQQSATGFATPGFVYALIGAAVASIWVSVVLASIFAPDMVTGSQQDHLPIVGITYWVWGLIATGAVMQAGLRGIRSKVTNLAPWLALAIAVAIVWVGVMLVGIFSPIFVTGTDPTRLPLAAMGAPIAGVVLTGSIAKFVEVAVEQPQAA